MIQPLKLSYSALAILTKKSENLSHFRKKQIDSHCWSFYQNTYKVLSSVFV